MYRCRIVRSKGQLYRFLHFCSIVLKPLVIAAKVKRYLRVKNAHKLLLLSISAFKAPALHTTTLS